MKTLQILCILSLVFLSVACNKDETPDNILAGEYSLIEVSSYMTDVVIKGDAIGYDQTYAFRNDNTFMKTRAGSEYDGQGTGTYTVTAADPNDQGVTNFLVLNFETGTDMINSCYPDGNTETLSLFDDGKLINQAAGTCDRPVELYKKRN